MSRSGIAICGRLRPVAMVEERLAGSLGESGGLGVRSGPFAAGRQLRGQPSSGDNLGPPVGVTNQVDNLLGGEQSGDATVAQALTRRDVLDIRSAQQAHYGVDRLAAFTQQFGEHPAARLDPAQQGFRED